MREYTYRGAKVWTADFNADIKAIHAFIDRWIEEDKGLIPGTEFFLPMQTEVPQIPLQTSPYEWRCAYEGT